MSEEKNHKFEKSLRIPFVILADILLMTLSFFVIYSFVAQYNKGINTAYDIVLSVVLYDVILLSFLSLFGCYKKKHWKK